MYSSTRKHPVITIKKFVVFVFIIILPFFSVSTVYANKSISSRVFSYKYGQVNLPARFKDLPSGSVFAIDMDIEAFKNLQLGDVVAFDLPNGQWNIVIDTISAKPEGAGVWVGHSETEGIEYRTIISYDGKTFAGSVNAPEARYSVRTEAGRVWLIDISKIKLVEPTAPDEDVIQNDGSIQEEQTLASAAKAAVKFNMVLPSYFRPGTASVIRWGVPTGFKGGIMATLRFAVKGNNFTVIKKVALNKGLVGVFWTPNKKFVTNNGKMEICAKNIKGTNVCQRIPGVKVLTPYAPSPVLPPPPPPPPVNQIPAPPTGLVATPMSSSAIAISWNASTGATGYYVYQNGVWLRFSGAGTSYTDVNLAANTTFSYTVFAYNTYGVSGSSQAVQAKTLPPMQDTTPPTVPPGLHSLSVTETSITIGWNPSTDNVGIYGYKVYRNGVYIGLRTDTSFEDTGLAPNTSYSYQVSAVDTAQNESGLSSVVTVKTYAQGNTVVTVEILVYHTPDISAARLSYLATLTNKAYSDSGIFMQVRIVGTIQVDYPVTTHHDVALNDLRYGVGVFTNVNNDRNIYGADLVTFITTFSSNQTNCGVAYLNGAGGTPLYADNAFSVVSDGPGCLDTVAPHEWGHNMGSTHERANSSGQGVFSYSYGYCVPNVAGDIMSYCGLASYPLFSSPKLTANGITLGVAVGQPEEADNVASINNVRNIVAGFMPTTR